MNTYKYFFGSDERSIPFLKTIHKHTSYLKVITTEPKQKGRGRKVIPNYVEKYCIENNIIFSYFKDDLTLTDMEFGICASFSKIFSENFLKRNNSIFNIHLSLLPEFRGPTPVEFTILKKKNIAGYTIFKIDSNIDTGKIIKQESFLIDNNTYASEVYSKIYGLFTMNFTKINFNNEGFNQGVSSLITKKFVKKDFNLNGLSLEDAKLKIRAFNTIGPAFIKFNNKIVKIHSYTNYETSEGIQLKDGTLYPDIVTPEGRKIMKFTDYLRGLK